MEKFDLLIIGSGPAGTGAAFRARSLGLTVCVVEKSETGGACLNRGCIPTKTLLHGAGLLREAREGERYGFTAGDIRFDFSKLIEWKNTVVSTLRQNQSAALVKAGVVMVSGIARVESPGKVLVHPDAEGGGEKILEAAAILIAAGTVPALLPIPGHDLPGVYTSDAFLEGDGLFPKRLAIIGGGVIGVEFAAAYSSFGSEVTIVEALPSILANMDREIGQTLALQLKKRGVGIYTGAHIDRIEGSGGTLALALTKSGGAGVDSITAPADAVLMAAGRKPDAVSLFAAGSAPQFTPKGFIRHDENMMSTIPGIYVAGDISGGVQLAHAAAAEGEYAASCIAAALKGGKKDPGGDRVIPSCVYTTPEIACAGITVAEAAERSIPAAAGKGVFGANGRAFLENQERGFIKLVFHAETRALIGAQFFCNRATEIIPWAVQCIGDGTTLEQIERTVFPHPSYCETIAQAVNDAVTRGGLKNNPVRGNGA
ncbi:dihydrolipoyl dehydrogenase [Spirochaetia bacterium]|nr:dihydrolipoyl dehydrogenase [Spirochaetia bacterium]